MTPNRYQELAQRTSKPEYFSIYADGKLISHKIVNGVMGLNGEAGECVDDIKKVMFQGHELNPDHLFEELGDVLWYVAETLTGLGRTMEECMAHNIEKLKARYPDGFSEERSVHRDI